MGFAAGEVEARLKLGLGKCFVEVLPGKGAAAVQLRGPARFSFVPDFFGNDVLFDARETAAAKVFAPAENFIVNLVEGHAALSMFTWPKDGGEEVLLLVRRHGRRPPLRRHAGELQRQERIRGRPGAGRDLVREGPPHGPQGRGAGGRGLAAAVSRQVDDDPGQASGRGGRGGHRLRDAARAARFRPPATRPTATSTFIPTCPVGSRAASGGCTWKRASPT